MTPAWDLCCCAAASMTTGFPDAWQRHGGRAPAPNFGRVTHIGRCAGLCKAVQGCARLGLGMLLQDLHGHFAQVALAVPGPEHRRQAALSQAALGSRPELYVVSPKGQGGKPAESTQLQKPEHPKANTSQALKCKTSSKEQTHPSCEEKQGSFWNCNFKDLS